MEWVYEHWLKLEGLSIKTKLKMEWLSSKIQVTLYGWLSDHGPLIITSGVIPEGIWDSVIGGWGSDEGSDGSTGADILAFFLGGRLADFLGREELAPSVVGGFLVLYRLREGLGGDPSTEGGKTSGCEGSVMESCTRTTLGGLWRPEGDRVLAPCVLGMADLEKVERGWPEVSVGIFFRQRSFGNGALAWLNFRTKGGFSQDKWLVWNGK